MNIDIKYHNYDTIYTLYSGDRSYNIDADLNNNDTVFYNAVHCKLDGVRLSKLFDR